MKAKIGNNEFNMEGSSDAEISAAFARWLDMVRQHARLPVIQRIAELEGELSAQRELLRRMDDRPQS